MKKLMLLITCLLLFVSINAQLQEQHDTLVVPVGADTLFSYNGFAPNGLGVEIDFRTANAFDGTLTFGGSGSKIDTLNGVWEDENNPFILNLTNFPDTIARIERTVGNFFPSLDILLTKESLTPGLKFPITIYSDRF
ncbi:hypothetical protein LCGC14_1163120 [marine sediment metagenome]|uniref:Uncharacterized protein n=1 Tax=marine sediment metagenome TaxID=412755 RepID=A0A0F9LX40_9ZZZZ